MLHHISENRKASARKEVVKQLVLDVLTRLDSEGKRGISNHKISIKFRYVQPAVKHLHNGVIIFSNCSVVSQLE